MFITINSRCIDRQDARPRPFPGANGGSYLGYPLIILKTAFYVFDVLKVQVNERFLTAILFRSPVSLACTINPSSAGKKRLCPNDGGDVKECTRNDWKLCPHDDDRLFHTLPLLLRLCTTRAHTGIYVS